MPLQRRPPWPHGALGREAWLPGAISKHCEEYRRAASTQAWATPMAVLWCALVFRQLGHGRQEIKRGPMSATPEMKGHVRGRSCLHPTHMLAFDRRAPAAERRLLKPTQCPISVPRCQHATLTT